MPLTTMCHHRFTLNGGFCVPIYAGTNNIFSSSHFEIELGHQKGVICAFFGVFSELLVGAAKILGSKLEYCFFQRLACANLSLYS